MPTSCLEAVLPTTAETVAPRPRELDLALAPDDPTPLYHQIAQAIRWRIGTGGLRPGHALPSLRNAADRWGVHLHTVRRAYRILADAGMLVSRPGAPTTVAPSEDANAHAGAPDSPPLGPEMDRWIERWLVDGWRRFGLTAEGLAARLEERNRTVPELLFVECNEHQCRDLAGQLASRLGVPVGEWALDTAGEPPAGLLIGTRFHAAEMRARWPDRVEDMRFVTLVVDPETGARLAKRLHEGPVARVLLCEADATTGRHMAAELPAAIGASDFEVRSDDPNRVHRSLGDGDLMLVAPRRWDALGEEARRDPRVIEVRHVIEPGDLDRFGSAR